MQLIKCLLLIAIEDSLGANSALQNVLMICIKFKTARSSGDIHEKNYLKKLILGEIQQTIKSIQSYPAYNELKVSVLEILVLVT